MSTDSMPPGSSFSELTLCDSSVSKLPDDLVVTGDLDMTDSLVTQLPKNLRVDGWLRLRQSQVSHLPDNLQVYGLNIAGSSVQTIGQNIKVSELVLDDPLSLTHPISSNFCRLDRWTNKTASLVNLNTQHLFLSCQSFVSLENLKCDSVLLKSSLKKTTVSIQNSVVNQFEVSINKRGTVLDLELGQSVSLNRLELHYIRKSSFLSESCSDPGLLRLYVRGARIHELDASNHLSCRVSLQELCMFGNLRALNNDSLALPENGIVYGDVYISRLIQVPASFSCVGTIHRD